MIETAAGSPTLHWTHDGVRAVDEPLAQEEPLAIEISYERLGQPVRKLLGITMRTPGADQELATGFLHAEGLIGAAEDIAEGFAAPKNSGGEAIATWVARLARAPSHEATRVTRSVLTTSACGLCGRPGLEGLPLGSGRGGLDGLRWRPEVVCALPDSLRAGQPLFRATGGSHGAALADLEGNLSFIREDVGRHNAVDKVIGAALRAAAPISRHALVLSGRASFELVQKAAAARIPLVLAVGAPSSFAVRLAHDRGITLVGFLRDSRFNTYTHADRVLWKS